MTMLADQPNILFHLISSDCPENQVIDFIAEYWLPDYPNHIIRQGKVAVKVTGSDQTPPEMKWAQSYR